MLDQLVITKKMLIPQWVCFDRNGGSARRWLQRKAMALCGQSPLSHARTEYGAGEVHDLIHRIEHGVIG